MIPSAMVSWVGRRLLSKLGKMEHVDVKLVPLSKVIADGACRRTCALQAEASHLLHARLTVLSSRRPFACLPVYLSICRVVLPCLPLPLSPYPPQSASPASTS